MKKYFFTFCCLLIISTTSAQTKNLGTIKIDHVPNTTEEFLELRNKTAQTPQGGAAIFILALKIYGENKDLGEKCLIIASDASLLSKTGKGYKGFSLGTSTWSLIKRQIKSYPYLPNSYFTGSNPNEGYQVQLPLQVESHSNPFSGNIEDGEFKIFIRCSGASTARPIRLVRNSKGYWKAKEFSSLLSGIKPPKKDLTEEDGDFK